MTKQTKTNIPNQLSVDKNENLTVNKRQEL